MPLELVAPDLRFAVMPPSRRFERTVLLLLVIGCNDAAGPRAVPGQPGTLAGQFTLTRIFEFAAGDICTEVTDPDEGDMITAALLTFDPDRKVVREQQDRITGFGCRGARVGDSITIDHERVFERRGDTVFIERPLPTGAVYQDSALLRSDTLLLFMKVVGAGRCLELTIGCPSVPLRYERP